MGKITWREHGDLASKGSQTIFIYNVPERKQSKSGSPGSEGQEPSEKMAPPQPTTDEPTPER
jgi:hypothetical protein